MTKRKKTSNPDAVVEPGRPARRKHRAWDPTGSRLTYSPDPSNYAFPTAVRRKRYAQVVSRENKHKPVRMDLGTEEARARAIFLIIKESGHLGVRRRRLLEKLYLPKILDSDSVPLNFDRSTPAQWRIDAALAVCETIKRLEKEGRLVTFEDKQGWLRVRPLNQKELEKWRESHEREYYIGVMEGIATVLGVGTDCENIAVAVADAVRERNVLRREVDTLRQQLATVEKLHAEIVEMKVAMATREAVLEMAARYRKEE